MTKRIKVLILEDNPADAELMVRELRRAGFEPDWTRVETEAAFRASLGAEFDLVLSDFDLPQFDGLSALRLLREEGRDVPLILVSGTIGEDTAVGAMREGAADYLLKDRPARLGPSVTAVLARRDLVRERGAIAESLARSDAELRASEEKFRRVFRSSPIPLVIMRASDERLLDVNDAFERLVGFEAERLVGRTPTEAGVRDADARGPDCGLVAAGRADASDIEIRTRTGVARVASVSSEVIELDGERCALVTLVDVTERRRAERQLQRYVSLCPSVIYALRITPDGYERVWASDNILALTGYTAEESRDSNWWAANIHPEDRERVRSELAAPPAVDHVVIEYRFRRKDGTYLWIHDEKRLVRDASGDAVEVVGSWSDVTDRVRLEEDLRQAQKMEAIGQLSGGVAHDFNNLLTIIEGHVWKIETSDPNADVRESVEIIKGASERAANLTRQLLLFGRRQAMQSRYLDLNDEVTQVSKMLRRVLGEDVRMRTDLSPSPMPVKGDAGMLNQVLLNLAVNARDAMPDGGVLTVETTYADGVEPPSTEPARQVADRYVRLSVGDTGCGIPPDALPHIFEPFFTTKDVGKGTGLGLATVFGIVQQHGGWITVESEVGRGTTFDVFLPYSTATERVEVAPTAAAPASGGGETILLVEDEDAVRMLIRTVLTRLGYRIVEAATGPEALTKWRAHRSEIRLLLTDLVMPDGMSGGTLAKRLREDRADLRVIYTSGYSPEFAGKDVALEEGKDFISKPFDPNALARVVRERLDG